MERIEKEVRKNHYTGCGRKRVNMHDNVTTFGGGDENRVDELPE
jgi:hypothetical protein